MSIISFFNKLLCHTKCPNPEKGMGVTILKYGKPKAGTIHKVDKNGKTIFISLDNVTKNTNDNLIFENRDLSENDNWKCYTLRKDGKYHQKGKSLNTNPLVVGLRYVIHNNIPIRES